MGKSKKNVPARGPMMRVVPKLANVAALIRQKFIGLSAALGSLCYNQFGARMGACVDGILLATGLVVALVLALISTIF